MPLRSITPRVSSDDQRLRQTILTTRGPKLSVLVSRPQARHAGVYGRS